MKEKIIQITIGPAGTVFALSNKGRIYNGAPLLNRPFEWMEIPLPDLTK